MTEECEVGGAQESQESEEGGDRGEKKRARMEVEREPWVTGEANDDTGWTRLSGKRLNLNMKLSLNFDCRWNLEVQLFPIFQIAMTVLCNLSERSRNAVSDNSTTVATSLPAKPRTVLIYVLRGAIIMITALSSFFIRHETYTNEKRHLHHSKFVTGPAGRMLNAHKCIMIH